VNKVLINYVLKADNTTNKAAPFFRASKLCIDIKGLNRGGKYFLKTYFQKGTDMYT
jgi:hypothetical protein